MQDSVQSDQPMNPLESKPKSGWGVLFLASAAIIIALTSLVFQFFFWQLHNRTEDKIAYQGHQLQASLQSQFQSFTAEINNQRQELNDQKQIISNLVAKNQSDERQRSLMKAEEAEHLLNLAQYNLMFENNIELASKLIVSADQKLQEMNDPGITPLRKTLSNDLTALGVVPKPDLTFLISRISTISEQVSTLSTLPVVSTTTSVKATRSAPKSWKEKLMDAFQSLRGIITIRRLPEDIKPMASPEQQIYIIENIRLKLTQAEWAVLHQNPTLYKNSLEQARAQLEKYYAHNGVGSNLIKMLNELLQVDIKPPVPDLSNTIALLHYYIHNTAPLLTAPNQQVAPAVSPQPTPPSSSVNIPPPSNLAPNGNNVNPPVEQNANPKPNNNLPQVTTNPIPRVLPS